MNVPFDWKAKPHCIAWKTHTETFISLKLNSTVSSVVSAIIHGKCRCTKFTLKIFILFATAVLCRSTGSIHNIYRYRQTAYNSRIMHYFFRLFLFCFRIGIRKTCNKCLCKTFYQRLFLCRVQFNEF